ncbi:MAG: response regulator [Phycisphaera sp. RhM]|nr:response regulator [Phycisphaera sp. RhM]
MSNKRYVILVEDDANEELLTIRAFKQINLANPIVVLRDGVEALDYILARGRHKDRDPTDAPCVVLLDLKLPKIDGFEVLRQIRSQEVTRHLPVVMMTSSDEQEDIIRSYQHGANGYVRKPIVYEEFVRAISQLGMYWCMLNEVPRS